MFPTPLSSVGSSPRWAPATGAVLLCAALLGFPSRAEAHGISEASSQTMAQGGILEFIWLGAEHMVTGYDHLLFLFGVIFFLTGFRDVVRFITAFTLGHCITLLGATLAGVTANAYLIDAVIALSVIYKGFENLDGFEKAFRIRPPNLLAMVFLFGLIHGFGLSTRLQELPLGDEGLVSRILAFNVGVELGQVAALTVMLGVFTLWRTSPSFERFANVTNSLLVLAGAGLFAYQVHGYFHETAHDAPHVEGETEHHEHGDDAGHEHGDDADHEHGDDADHEHGDDADHEHGDDADPEPVTDPNAADPEPLPDNAAGEEPAEEEHGHGHSHGHGHGHSHGHSPEPAVEAVEEPVEEPPEEPVEEEKSHSHSHGSGEAHTH